MFAKLPVVFDQVGGVGAGVGVDATNVDAASAGTAGEASTNGEKAIIEASALAN
jgi:hypothetical protein